MAPSPLKIKINALSRLVKEEGLYKIEAEEQQKRIDKMKESGPDEYELKKQVCRGGFFFLEFILTSNFTFY